MYSSEDLERFYLGSSSNRVGEYISLNINEINQICKTGYIHNFY